MSRNVVLYNLHIMSRGTLQSISQFIDIHNGQPPVKDKRLELLGDLCVYGIYFNKYEQSHRQTDLSKLGYAFWNRLCVAG